MASYVISDIHGEYDMFMELLRLIDFSYADTLYILGDVVDRGPHPIAVLQKLMKMPNVIPIVGNHEVMALDGLQEVMSGKKDILVIKSDPILIGSLIHNKGYLPAYHMSKKNWVTVLLDGSAPDEQVKDLIHLSYEIIEKAKR